MVLAEHRTPTGRRTAITVETVAFERPDVVRFRLVRGPVPSVVERFELIQTKGGRATRLTYTGEMATDGWAIGARWGNIVASKWDGAVNESLQELAEAARSLQERRMARDTSAESSGPRSVLSDRGDDPDPR
jgi:hypothetical protein